MIQPPDPAVTREVIARALAEDVGPADITTLAVVEKKAVAVARVLVKEQGVLCGVTVAEKVFHELDAGLQVELFCQDGDLIRPGQDILRVRGPARAILTGERVALNFLQHLSGIATNTARYVEAVKGTKTKILDTRKTAPGLRLLEKYAVRCGGGHNHRLGLYDEFLIKDNHLALSEKNIPLAEVIQRTRQFNPEARLTVEAETLDQVKKLAELRVDQILLDNMSEKQMAQAVQIVAGRCKLEASGGITLKRIPSVAATGVDFISVGALTHHTRALDFSLEIGE